MISCNHSCMIYVSNPLTSNVKLGSKHTAIQWKKINSKYNIEMRLPILIYVFWMSISQDNELVVSQKCIYRYNASNGCVSHHTFNIFFV